LYLLIKGDHLGGNEPQLHIIMLNYKLLEVEKKAEAARSLRSRDLHDESSTKLSRIARMPLEILDPEADWKQCRHKIDSVITISSTRVSLSPCITHEEAGG
jgi:hypothetical protein